jgi:hypothetical protein
VALAVLLLALTGAPAVETEIDWAALAAPDVVRIVTVDPDGSVRERKVWIALHAGRAWLRTGNSRWLENIRRDPRVKLRVGEQLYVLRAEEVDDPELRRGLDAAMRAKYGWEDRMLTPLRWPASHAIRLGPAEP